MSSPTPIFVSSRRRGQQSLPLSAPDGNTGAEISADVSYRIDWIEVFHASSDVPTIAGLVGFSLPLWQVTEADFYGYNVLYTSPLGHRLYSGKSGLDGPLPHCKLICPGSTLAGFTSSLEIVRRASSSGAKITRLDLAIDDRTGSSSISRINRTFTAGDFVTHFRDLLEMSKKRLRGDNPDQGSTLYLGSSTSERRLRIYDKAKEQHVDGDWIRFEIQARKESAQMMADNLLAGVDPCGLLCSMVDFRAVKSRKHTDQAIRLPWWEKVVSSAIPCRFSPSRPVDSLARRVNWMNRQGSKTLALLVACCGSGALASMVNAGMSKLSPAQVRYFLDGADMSPLSRSELLSSGLVPF